MHAFQDILYHKENRIATLTLNRPDNFNAFSEDMLKGWAHYLAEGQNDPEVRVIVVTGAGKAFCAGGDVKSMAKGQGFIHQDNEQAGNKEIDEQTPLETKNSLWKLVHRVPLTLEDVEKPVIASINGAAMGAGLDMALWCDLRLAAEDAPMGETYINLGLVPGDGGAFLLPRLVGLSRALELLLTGKRFTGREAEVMGLVNRAVPGEELERATYELAGQLAAQPPFALQAIKRAVYQGLKSSARDHLDYISSQMALAAGTEDHAEGLNAMLEKKTPSYKGR